MAVGAWGRAAGLLRARVGARARAGAGAGAGAAPPPSSAAEALLRGELPLGQLAGGGRTLRESLSAAGLEAVRDLPGESQSGGPKKKRKVYGRGEAPVEPEVVKSEVKPDITSLLPGTAHPTRAGAAGGADGAEDEPGGEGGKRGQGARGGEVVLPLPGPLAQPSVASGRLKRDEVMLEVAVSHGGRFGLVHQRFLVYGSQPLTELRDRIGCQADAIAEAGNVASNNAFFFVGRVFYDDTRHPGAQKLSKNVLTFLRQRQKQQAGRGDRTAGGDTGDGDKSGKGPYRAVAMQDATFLDLRVDLGFGPDTGAIYCHQGSCEHLLTFTDVRLLHPRDPPMKDSYPLTLSATKPDHLRQLCLLCRRDVALLCVYGGSLCPSEPAFYCRGCFRMLYYSAQGELLEPAIQVFEYPNFVPK